MEAIVQGESRPLPLAYYTPENIDLGGTANVGGMSFFAGGNITGAGGSFTKIGSEPDLLTGDWSTLSPSTSYVPSSNYNTVSRGTTATGFGTAGRVREGNNTAGCKSPPAGTSFFDSDSDPQLVVKEDPEAGNESATISYPFAQTILATDSLRLVWRFTVPARARTMRLRCLRCRGYGSRYETAAYLP